MTFLCDVKIASTSTRAYYEPPGETFTTYINIFISVAQQRLWLNFNWFTVDSFSKKVPVGPVSGEQLTNSFYTLKEHRKVRTIARILQISD